MRFCDCWEVIRLTPLLLLEELKLFLECVVADYKLETNRGQAKAPQVVEGWLPPKESTDVPDVPYVMPRLIEGEDNADESQVNIKILVGTYSEDIDGWKDAVNVILRIRQCLLINRTLGKKFRMELPLKWKLFEEQPYPIWIGEIITIWTVALPIEQVEEDVYEYQE
ncbi:MAG TPA: hypothetical protein PLM20_07575 [Syntrophomonadaceae bacterium]|nr:hypothetical protein [Syntrophomonadaceae bacterium]HQE23742.1 hypothetical protein [Syntrophomonadaceae bacterium]